MQVITKYDYCQACHLLLTECRCNAEVKLAAPATASSSTESYPIYISTWQLSFNGVVKTVKDVVVKGTSTDYIKQHYLSRALKASGVTNKSLKVIVVSLVLDRQIGFSNVKD